MPSFAYTARDSLGSAVSGTLSADSLDHAQQLLRAEGKYPVRLCPAEEAERVAGAENRGGIRVPRQQVIAFATQLSVMVETGVVLSEAIDCIAAQADTPDFKALVEDLGQTVQQGKDFSHALARHPRSFSRMFIAVIRASEKSGMLAKLLARATHYLRDEQETSRRVRGALTYPAIMLGFAVSVTVFLLAFVLPRFASIYAAKKAALPTPTRMLLAVSDGLVNHYPAVLGGLAATIVAALVYGRSPRGRRRWHALQLGLPLMGTLYRKLHLSRGLRMVGTLCSAGVSLVDCVSTARDLCANVYFRDLWKAVSDDIQAGKQVSETLFGNRLVPRPVAQMLRAGEKAGKLGQVMEQVAAYAEAELKEEIAALTRYIEPAMIVLMGMLIGGIALALLLPIFTISKVVAN